VALGAISGGNLVAIPSQYSGGFSGFVFQYINPHTDSTSINVFNTNALLVGGPGNDPIQAFGGSNVLDGGTGSNLLTGGSGTNTLFGVDPVTGLPLHALSSNN
jgi:Ca2+-binding RTX toxin-like protein